MAADSKNKHRSKMCTPACKAFSDEIHDMVEDGTVSGRKILGEAAKLARSLLLRADTGSRKRVKGPAKRRKVRRGR